MDQILKAAIHKFAENREIDYMSAKNLGNAYGIEFDNEQELVEFKQTIDRYLKTFEEEAFAEIEEACKKKKKKKKTVEEEYDVQAFAKVNNDQPSGGYIKTSRAKKSKKTKKKKNMKEGVSLDNFF